MSAQVLIIEDEGLLAANLAKALARHGVEAEIAGSIRAAELKTRENRYQLVCADVELGDGNGLSFCHELRRREPELPVIVMTGQDTAGNRLSAEGLGAMAFVAKPFALSRFRDLVATLLHDNGPGGASRQADRGPCVLMYSHDTIGLGHMRRNSAIAARIVEQNPRASVLMLVGSPSGVVFDLAPGVDYVKLPSLSKVARDVWRPQSLRLSSEDTRTLRGSIIAQAVESFDPDVILVDHEPAGVWNELQPVLERTRSTRPHTRIILGLRDVIDEPERTRTAWVARGTCAFIADHYDDILVYGQEDVFPTVVAYGLDGLVRGDVRYCGYVTAVNGLAAVTKNAHSKTQRPRVVVAGGGGRDAYVLLTTFLDAIGGMTVSGRPDVDMIGGPLMDKELREPLLVKARELGVRFHQSHSDLPSLLKTADLFVTMAGYNSIVEGIATGCPMLIVPRVGPSAEQLIRASRLAELGHADIILPGDLTAQSIALRLNALRVGAPRHPHALSLDGAGRAADFICAAFATAPRFHDKSGREVINA